MEDLSLYVHVPFCKKKCAYCSFYSIADASFCDEYTKALQKYIEYYAKIFSNRKIATIYIGGGTPFVLGEKNLAILIEDILRWFNISSDLEFTIEANPESASLNVLKDINRMGVNRISFGVQSLSDLELEILGRLHDAETAEKAIENAKTAGFSNISCDLIYGLPTQTVVSFEKSLTRLLDLGVSHISAYNLQLEKGTELYKLKDKYTFPDEDEEESMYELLCDSLKSNGFLHYEISNFAKDSKISLHNFSYWERKEYLGLGPAAHSFLNESRLSFDNDFNTFIRKSKKNNFSFDTEIKLSKSDDIFENIMLSLRTYKGISINYLKEACINTKKLESFLTSLYKGGFAEEIDGKLILNDKGFFVSNEIISEILTYI